MAVDQWSAHHRARQTSSGSEHPIIAARVRTDRPAIFF